MRKFLSSGAIAMVLVLAAPPVLADVKAGVEAWGRGDYAGAVAEWKGPAAAGDADAQFNLGQAYKLGRGVPMDLNQAAIWYERASKQGHLQASDNYGLILFQNNEREKALPYLTAASARGEPRAQYVLGTGHFNGDFVPKDWVKAYALMTRASAQGLPQASTNLSKMDQYVKLEDRQKAIALAGQMEQQEQRQVALLAGGLRAAPPAQPMQTASLPPSQVATPAPPPSYAPPPPENPGPGAGYTPPPVNGPVASYSPPPPQNTPPAYNPPEPSYSAPVAQRSGNWRIQLGAFGDQGRAKALWNSLEARVSGMSELQPYLVTSGAITRLQAGPFETSAQADKMCRSVKAAGSDCIIKAQ
jgi:cell division protein FtsN